MASKPNPSWTEPQRKLHKDVQEAMEIAIPYFGPEIPRLDNHTPQQLCDTIGVVKAARKAFDQVEKTLIARFKPTMGAEGEVRGTRYVATNTQSERTALNQSAIKELLARADTLGIDLQKFLDLAEAGELEGHILATALDGTNTERYYSTTEVETLRVEAI